jgi:type II secretion system protein J
MKRAAFTLLELLVAMAVLVLLLVLLVQVIGAVSDTWRSGTARIHNFSKARVILSLLDRDIQAAVLRRDLAAFVDESGSPACAFYAKARGGDGDRRLALIRYARLPGSAVLQRADYGLDYRSRIPTFSETGSLADLDKASVQEVADGIIGFAWQFLASDGSFQSAFQYDYDHPLTSSNTKAMVVSLLVLDEAALRTARDTGSLPALLAEFAPPPSPGKTHADAWNDTLSSSAFGTGLPAPVRRGLRAFQRCILLP